MHFIFYMIVIVMPIGLNETCPYIERYYLALRNSRQNVRNER
jgi:hypothetical protein